jgi:uncharacterized membrane protein
VWQFEAPMSNSLLQRRAAVVVSVIVVCNGVLALFIAHSQESTASLLDSLSRNESFVRKTWAR